MPAPALKLVSSMATRELLAELGAEYARTAAQAVDCEAAGGVDVLKRVQADERVLVTTLTKRMAEDLTDYLGEHGVKVRYLHSDIDTVERSEIIRDLRLGKFDVIADVELAPDAAFIKPGMACSLKFTTYRAHEALTVPSSAVFEDEADDGTMNHVVYLPGKEGKPEKKTIKTGKTAGGKTEILAGLLAGDEILSSKP